MFVIYFLFVCLLCILRNFVQVGLGILLKLRVFTSQRQSCLVVCYILCMCLCVMYFEKNCATGIRHLAWTCSFHQSTSELFEAKLQVQASCYVLLVHVQFRPSDRVRFSGHGLTTFVHHFFVAVKFLHCLVFVGEH